MTDEVMMRTTDQAIRISHVVGNSRHPDFHDRIHALEHRHAVEVVTLPAEDLARRRILTRTCSGLAVAIALPREQRLFDGAILFLDDTKAIVVRAEAEQWLRFTPRSVPDAIELGYHAGNLHWRVRFDGNDLLVPLEGRVEDYAARLAGMVPDGRVEIQIIDGSARADISDHAHGGHHHSHPAEGG